MIVELNISNYKSFENDLIPIEIMEKEMLSNPFCKYIVYIDNKKNLIGFIYYSDIYDRLEINQIEVLSQYRNNHVASKMMSYLISLEEKNITLEVKCDNIAAINLYKKFNFKDVAVRKAYYNGIDGILMERKIK